MKMNHLKVERSGDSIFVALPVACWEPIPDGCSCAWCKAHPEQAPAWDTLVIDPTGTYNDTSRCHYPELQPEPAPGWNAPRKPARKPVKAPDPVRKLNAVGKPYGASYDPNYRMKYRRNVIAELCRPYDRRHHGPSFVSDAQCERMIAAWKASGTWARGNA